MSFIVEDGSGKKGATSYATVAGFRAYFADRAVDVTSMTDPDVQALLVLATDYIDTRWGQLLKGFRYWNSLLSRVVFSLSDQPSDGDTVTVGSATATFRTSATEDDEAEIGDTLIETLSNLSAALARESIANDGEIEWTLFPNPDTAALVVFVSRDGVSASTTAANGSFDSGTSSGKSYNQQPLEFPRVDLCDRNGNTVEGIPDRLVEATYEYAYRANVAALAPDPEIDSTSLRLSKKLTKVGPITTERQYVENQNIRITKPYPAADRLLKEYVTAGGGVIRA